MSSLANIDSKSFDCTWHTQNNVMLRSVNKRYHWEKLTTNINEIVSNTVSTNMDENPISSKVLRPESSTRNREINVISTFKEPIPSVAYLAPSVLIPAISKIFVEKNMT